jgi:hypothetical protein
LQDLSAREKDYVLGVVPANFSEDAERGPSKEATGVSSKEVDASKDPNKVIKGELYVTLSWLYPAFELNEETGECRPREGEDGEEEGEQPTTIKERAEIQIKLHTGRLRMTIKKAAGLRRADALKGRDCDAQVTAWVRNDVTMKWKDKPMAKTAVAKNSRNPVWNEDFKGEAFEILSGEFEARFDEEEEGFIDNVKNLFKSKQTKRHEEEEEDVAYLNKFGSTGLKVKFLEKEGAAPGTPAAKALPAPTPSAAPEPPKADAKDAKKAEESEGQNHEVEIFLGDTIREFKQKLTEACKQECAFWGKQGVAKDDVAQRYRDVTIAYQHLVMVFIPTPKVQQLFAQGLHEGKEYKHAYQMAVADPSCWQPLDPARTFQQYPQFAFGRKQPQLLRVVEATESYKLLNLRYKEFDKENTRTYYHDINTVRRCYGYAKYVHKADTGGLRDYEWRPAFITPDDQAEDTKEDKGGKQISTTGASSSKYIVDWVLRPKNMDKKKGADVDDAAGDPISKTEVMFYPRCAVMNDNFSEEHREVLDQAKSMRLMGKSDFEIQGTLNKMVQEKYEKSKDKKKLTKPTPITVDIIRSYIAFKDAEKAAKEGDGQ